MKAAQFNTVISAGAKRPPIVRGELLGRRLYAVTTRGKRPDNQDGFLIAVSSKSSQLFGVFAGDGMGGDSNGEIACDLALKGIKREMKTLRTEALPIPSPLPQWVEYADNCISIFNRGSPTGISGTVLSGVFGDLKKGVGYACGFGDASVFHVTPGGVISLLLPHTSFANEVWHRGKNIRMGEEFPCTDEPGSRFSSLRDYFEHIRSMAATSHVSGLIGAGIDHGLFSSPVYHTTLFNRGDRFFVIVDGLTLYVEFDEFARILRSSLPLDQTVESLISAAEYSSDNVTVSAVEA